MLATGGPLQLALACALAGAISVAIFNPVPIYDTAAWLVWAAEIVHRTVALEAGPSWKPLPVIAAAPATIVSWPFAAAFWLWTVRTCAFATSVFLWKFASRSGGGKVAGAVAAIAPWLIADWVHLTLGGGSEPVLMALLFGAVAAHLADRRFVALALGAAAGLLRPEVWIFLSLYGLWLLYEERARALLPLAVGAAAQVVGWFLLPAAAGADPFSASDHARAYIDSIVPLSVFAERTLQGMPWGVWLLAVVGVGLAVKARELVLLALAGGAVIWVAAVAVETRLGFSGIGRYSLPALVMMCALAGYACGRLLAATKQSKPLHAAAAACLIAVGAIAAVTGAQAGSERFDRVHQIDEAAANAHALIAQSGGMAKLVARCGPIGTNWRYSTTLAWNERQTLGNLSRAGYAPAIILIRDRSWSDGQPVPPRRWRSKQILATLRDWKLVEYQGPTSCSERANAYR